MNVNEMFPHKVCVNLDRRPERWARAQAEFARHSIGGVVRFPAVDGARLTIPTHWGHTPGSYGCLQSHLAIVREARKKNLPRVLIFEDDVVLHTDFNARFSECAGQLPKDWDMLYFGGLHVFKLPLKVSENVVKLAHSYSTFAYALNHTIYDAFIELNEQTDEPVDLGNLKLQQTHNCYGFMPHLAWVEESYSDTYDMPSHPWYIKESLVLLGPEWDRVEKKTGLVLAHHNRSNDQRRSRNLSFILSYYAKHFSGIEALVVEQGEKPASRPQWLPAACRYELLEDAGTFDRDRCFQLGLERFGSTKEFFIFAESDIHLEHEHVVANLELCRRHDFVSAFGPLIDLTEEDTLRIINGEQINATKYERHNRADICRGACFFTLKGIEAVKGWNGAAPGSPHEAQSAKVKRLLSAFESPNRALRLYCEGRAS